MYRILTDEEIEGILDSKQVIDVIKHSLLARAEGALVAPPRFSVGVDHGELVFTAGAETKYTHSIGFRVYETFLKSSPDHTQFVAVFDSETGEFHGLVIGKLVGVLRTAAINAVAIQHMARPDAINLGILGSGFQARYHLQASMEVRRFQQVMVYSPTPSHRERFAMEMTSQTGYSIHASSSAEEVVHFADVLICATTSNTPVVDPAWIKRGTHINHVGPKFKGRSEIPYALAQQSQVIATDSLDQVDAYSESFYLTGSPERERMVDLSEIVAGRQKGRHSPSDITLFCSVGLAGTEVVVASEILKKVMVE